MNIDDLQAALTNQDDFRKLLRQHTKSAPTSELAALLAGNFQNGAMANIYRATLPNGSQLRLKFYDTIKRIVNNKNVELIGRESSLSYLEVSVMPIGSKGYYFTESVVQSVWGGGKQAALANNEQNKSKLLSLYAIPFGICSDSQRDLVWTTTYTENY